jgi:O-antigen/teichoic acid export membrane protein
MVPLILHHLGATTYGLYAALASLVGYFGLLTFGSSLTVPRYVAEHAARGDNDALGTFFSTYLAAHLAVALAGVIGAFGLAPLVAQLLGVPADIQPLVIPAFRLVAVGWALGLSAGLHQSLLTGLGEVQLANLANSARTLVNLAAVAAALRSGGGLTALLLAQSLASLAGSVGLWLLVRSRHPEIPVALGRARLETLRATGTSAVYYFLMQVAALAVMGTDNIVIGAFIGVAAVAPYAVMFQLWAMTLAVLWSGADVLMPYFTRWQAQGDRATLTSSYLLATKVVFAGSVLAAVIMGVFGISLVRRWVGPSLEVDPRLPWVFAAMLLIATPIHMAALLLSALGRHRAPAIGGAIEAVLNLTLSLILVRPLGVLGVALGTLGAGLLTNAWIAPVTACRELGIPVFAYLRRVIATAVVPGAVAGASALLIAARVVPGSAAELAGIAAVIVAFGLLFWWLGLDAHERRALTCRSS